MDRMFNNRSKIEEAGADPVSSSQSIMENIMTTPIFDHKSNELIIVTEDQRIVNAIIKEDQAATLIDELPHWIKDVKNPTDLVGYVVQAVTKLGSDLVSPRELEEELIRATDRDDMDLHKLCRYAIIDLDDEVDPDLPTYYQAMDCVVNHLQFLGIIKPCCYYESSKVVGYHIEMAGMIIREVLFGEDQETTIIC